MTKTAPDGQVLVVFSPYTVLKALGDNGTNHSWLNKKIEDLEETRIDTEIKGMKIRSAVVRKHAKSLLDNKDAQRRGGIAKNAKYWYVIFEAEYSLFFIHDVKLHYQSLLPEILRLDHAVTKKLVRFCLSHDQVNMALNDILLAIGSFDWVREDEDPDLVRIVSPVRTQQRIRKSVMDESEALRRDFGIEIRKMADGREGIFYKKHPKVLFESPEKSVLTCYSIIDDQKTEIGQGDATV